MRAGGGAGGPGGALPGPKCPEAAPGARWERRPDAARRRGVPMWGPGPRGPAGAHPPPYPRARGTGVHGAAKGTFATFERARSGRGRGGDRASGASAACLVHPGPATAQRKARAGEERSGLGAGRPAHRGPLGVGCPPPGNLGWSEVEGCLLPHGDCEVTPLPPRVAEEAGVSSPPLPEGDCGD